MRTTDEIEKDITNELGESGTDYAQDLWLEYLQAKNEKTSQFAQKIIDKDPIVIGATIGAIVGHLFLK